VTWRHGERVIRREGDKGMERFFTDRKHACLPAGRDTVFEDGK